MAWQSLFDWCLENGEWGKQLLFEFGDGNNSQEFTNEYGMPVIPSDFAKLSNKKIKWTCSKNSKHQWEAAVSSRVSGSNCPYCSGKVASEDNNLLTWCKQNGEWGQKILNEWTGLNENNEPVKMTDFTKASGKRVKWKCSVPTCSYEWVNGIHDRTSHRRGCPLCASNIVIEGKNDLKTFCLNNEKYRHLIDEWTGIGKDESSIKMTEVSRATAKKVLWHCSKCDNEWYASISDRASKHRSMCPFCSKVGTSYPEQALYRSLKQLYPNTINRGKFNNIEYDIMITDTTPHVYIEYSAINWHINKLDRDEKKASICKENNIRFIQIYAHSGQIEIDEDIFDENQIIYRVASSLNSHNQQLTEILQHILNSLGHNISEINIEKAQTEAFNFMHDIEEQLEDF